MKVEFSPRAVSDLTDIGDYIAKDNPANADNFVNALLDYCLDIKHAPEGYTARPELGANIRSLPFKAYMIFYTPSDTQFYTPSDTHIRIERILHGSRDYLSGKFL